MHRGNSGFIRLPAGAVREHTKCFRRLALLPTVSSKTVRRKDRVSEFPRTDCGDDITALILTILHNPVGHGAAVFGAAHQTFHQH
jgi:hypothetical protein